MIFNRIPNPHTIVRIPDFSNELKTLENDETYKVTQNCWLIGSARGTGGTASYARIYINDKEIFYNNTVNCAIPLKRHDVVRLAGNVYDLKIYAMMR